MNPDNANDDQLTRLLVAMWSENGGADHLPDEEMVSYVFGDLSEVERARADAHLVVCDSCRAEIGRTGEIARVLNSRESEDYINRAWNGFRHAVEGRSRLTSFLKGLFQLGSPVARVPARRATGAGGGEAQKRAAVADGSEAGGLLRWRFEQDPSGQLHGCITATDASVVPVLDGATITLATDPPSSTTLALKDGVLLAEFTISEGVWRRLPQKAALIRRVVLADGIELTPENHDPAMSSIKPTP